MTKDEALKLALGALESIEWHNGGWGLDPDLVETAITAINELLTQPSQEHVAWMYDDNNKLVPLFTAPPQRPWIGLTDEEIDTTWKKWIGTERANKSYTLAIEATLRSKNT